MKRRKIATTITILFLIAAPVAQAFKTVQCDGAKLKWPGNSNNMKMTRNKCSVGNGSAQADSYFGTINRWNEVGGMWDKIEAAFMWPSDHCFMEFDDGENDFALVNAAQIDGNLGSTMVFRDCPEIFEVDILMANLDTQGFTNPDETVAIGASSNTGRFAVLHEFGHGLGLSIQPKGSSTNAHVTGYAVMRASPPTPLAGGGSSQQHARVMPDDAAGVRFLYPSGNNEFNLMASAQSFDGSTVVNNSTTSTVNRCRGASVNFVWSMVNAGTTNVTCDQRFFISTSSTAHNSAGITLTTWFDATVFGQSAVFPSVAPKIPCGTPPGLYFLYHQVDSNNEFGEWNESDNVVRLPMKIQVDNCGC